MTSIRTATIEDVDQLSHLMDLYRIFYRQPSDIEQAKIFLSERITLSESVIFVAEREGIMVGFTQLYPLFSSVQMKKMWLLNDLFVHSDARKQKVGIDLIERAKLLCVESKNCGGLLLETEKTNAVGNNLYPKTGFILDEENNYYCWST